MILGTYNLSQTTVFLAYMGTARIANYNSINIVYNPNSTGQSTADAKLLYQKLKRLKKDLPIHLLETKYAGHAEKLVYECCLNDQRALIISASGDGGYNEAVNGAMKAQAAGAKPICAVLPSGNANDHSRTLQQASLYKLIKNGKVNRIDLLSVGYTSKGRKHKRFAHSYVGLGLTPAVAAELNKTNLNLIKELWLVVKTFFAFQPLSIRVNDQDITVDSVLFANISEMAKKLTISKEASSDDGKFEVVLFAHRTKLSLLWKIFRASISKLDEASQVESFKLTALNKTKLQLDGEVLSIDAGSKISVEIEHQILTTFI